jgi:hypothetical protein
VTMAEEPAPSPAPRSSEDRPAHIPVDLAADAADCLTRTERSTAASLGGSHKEEGIYFYVGSCAQFD